MSEQDPVLFLNICVVGALLGIDVGLVVPFLLLFVLARAVEQDEYQKDECLFLPEGHPSMIHDWVRVSMHLLLVAYK